MSTIRARNAEQCDNTGSSGTELALAVHVNMVQLKGASSYITIIMIGFLTQPYCTANEITTAHLKISNASILYNDMTRIQINKNKNGCKTVNRKVWLQYMTHQYPLKVCISTLILILSLSLINVRSVIMTACLQLY